MGGTTRVGQWWFTLDEFLDRAERVLTSEIARRADLATVGTTMKLIVSLADGVPSQMIREVPREADVESAAARVRPLFLQDDPVHHGKVTNAMGGLAQSAPEPQRQAIKQLKKTWQDMDTGYRWSVAVNVGAPPEPEQHRTDRQIARDFVYGDLVHADPEARQRLRLIPEGDRLLAAVVWVADAIRRTQATKQLIVDLKDAGYLTPRP